MTENNYENKNKENNSQSLSINNRLIEEINNLKKQNTQLELKLLKYEEQAKGGLSVVEVNKELEKRIKENQILIEQYENKIGDTMTKLRTLEEKYLQEQETTTAEQTKFLVTLKAIKREKEIVKEEEVVDTCRRIINLKETIEKFQEAEFPGYIDTLNLINYLKEELDRFLLIKNVEEIYVDFRNIDSEKIIILSNQAQTNSIVKTGYSVNGKIIYPAEIELNPNYLLTLRDLAVTHGSDYFFEKKLRAVIDESLALQAELLIEIQKYLLQLESKHLLLLPDSFKNFFKRLLIKYFEENPEVAHMKLSYQKIKNRITEEFRKILEVVPSFDIIKSARTEMKEQDQKINLAFKKWETQMEEELVELKEWIQTLLSSEEIDTELAQRFPWKIKTIGDEEEKIRGYLFLKRAKYFSGALINTFKKEMCLEFGTEKDLYDDFYALFFRNILPKDLFIDVGTPSLESVFIYIDKLLGVVDEEEFKTSLKNLLLAKGFLTINNYQVVIREIRKLDFTTDLIKRKQLIINLLEKNFK